jgi:hypothetical protein
VNPSPGGISDLSLDQPGYWAGIRFDDVGIPQCARIQDVAIRLCISISSWDNADEVVSFEAHDDAPAFAAIVNNVSDRTRTVAQAAWKDSDLGSGCHEVRLPELRESLQEVVMRPGWLPGNALVFLDEHLDGAGKLEIDAWNNGVTRRPRLTVTYQAP